MIWAIKDNVRIRAEPNITANCDVCGKEVISKCGNIKVWHFAHKVSADCDYWSEEETQWHKDWKNEFPNESQEVKVGCHRADVKHNGLVIEFQHSSISSKEIQERENYYKNMVWVLDGNSLCLGLDLRNKKGIITFRWKTPPKSWWYANKQIYIDLSSKINNLINELRTYYNGKKTFKTVSEEVENEYGGGTHWENDTIETTNLSIIHIKNQIQLLNNKSIFLIKKIYKNIPCGGLGILISKEEFLKRFKDGYNKN